MTMAVVQFAITAAIIVVAGTFLTRFAEQIAERTGIGRLLVGSILLAGATSLPELTVDIPAVRNGLIDLACGDLVGSSLFNLLILAIVDLSSRTRGRMFSHQAAKHALSGNVSAALTAILALSLLAAPIAAGGELLGLSYGLWFVVLAYVLGIRMVYYDQQIISKSSTPSDGKPSPEQDRSLGKPIAGFVAAALAIIIAGPYLAEAAGRIAEHSGLGTTFVGTTLVAFSTSMPELVTSIVALRMGAHELVIGNVFGSNAFNMVLFAPLDWVHAGPLLAELSPQHAVTAVAVILATMIAVLGQLYHVERRQYIIECDAWLVLIVVLSALGMIYQLR